MEITLYTSQTAADMVQPSQPTLADLPSADSPSVNSSLSTSSLLRPTAYRLPTLNLRPFLRLASLGLVLFAAGSLIYVNLPALKQEIAYRSSTPPKPAPSENFSYVLAKMEEETKAAEAKRQLIEAEAAKYGVTTDYSIVIPKIAATAKIVPNVNAADKTEYMAALKQGVAQAAGSTNPGEGGTNFLFAHSTNIPENIAKYNALFFLLKELSPGTESLPGDDIILFYQGQKFHYRVTEKVTVDATDTKWLTHEEGVDKLVLQTCWPPGTTWKRLLVVAKPI